MTFEEAERYIAEYEQLYFRGESFSESFIRNDLELRKTRDRLSTMGSGRPTNELTRKKSVYYQWFNENLGGINRILDEATNRSWDTIIDRCERCKEQANRLLNLVRDF